MDADHHAFVQGVAGLDEHAAAVIELAQRIGHRLAIVLADQHAVLAPFDLALVRLVAVEDVADQARAARHVEELVLEADQAARRDLVLEAHPAHAVGLHVDELGLALAERLHHGALVLVFDVGGHLLDRLEPGVAFVLEHDPRLGHRELVAFAAHVLEQDRQVQLAAARDFEHAVFVGVAHLQRDIGLQLAVEPVADLPARDELAFAAGERRVVDAEVHRQGRLVDFEHRQRQRGFDVGQRHADADAFDAVDQHDVAGAGFGGLLALEAFELQHLIDARVERRAVGAAVDRDVLHRLQGALIDAPDADPADVGRIVERADLQLQRVGRAAFVRRHMFEDRVEQRREVGALLALGQARPAVQARREDDREVELRLGGMQLVEQVEGRVDHVVGTRARAVDLVDDDDGLQAKGERLLGDEAGLRHRAFDRVDQQQHAVDHRQHPLDFAAEVGMPGGVDDVDVGALPLDRAVLREDRDAALAFEVVAVHHALCDLLVLAEGAALAQQLVHERGLAVVDVGDDGDVANLSGHGVVLLACVLSSRRPCTSTGLRSLFEINSPPAMWALPRKARECGP